MWLQISLKNKILKYPLAKWDKVEFLTIVARGFLAYFSLKFSYSALSTLHQ